MFGIVQGGLDLELRKKSLKIVQSTDVDGVAIGGLSVGEPRKDMHEMLDYLAPLHDERPRYLMGVGHPIDMRHGIERGIDMFDCVLPTRNARHGSAWVSVASEGVGASGGDEAVSVNTAIAAASAPSTQILTETPPSSDSSSRRRPGSRHEIVDPFGLDLQVNFKSARFKDDQGVVEQGCDCYTCTSGYSRSFIRHLLKSGETLGGQLLSIHNLRYLQRICESYRLSD